MALAQFMGSVGKILLLWALIGLDEVFCEKYLTVEVGDVILLCTLPTHLNIQLILRLMQIYIKTN